MAAIGGTNQTLIDIAKQTAPDGSELLVAELLAETNSILEDAVFVEANEITGHRVAVRTGLPTVYWRSYGQGVPASKSTVANITEPIGLLSAHSDVDAEQIKLFANPKTARLNEDRAFIEAMNIKQAMTMFYGDGTVAGGYSGLALRYSAIAGAGNAQNIIDGGGISTVNTSVWLVVWGDNSVFCTYPRGSKAGLSVEDRGRIDVLDITGNPYVAMRTWYSWNNGLVVKDWRQVVRICNIDTTNLASGVGAADVIVLMAKSLDRVWSLKMGRAAFYCNRTVFSALRVQAMAKSQNVLTFEKGLNQFGTPDSWMTFSGVPVRQVDELLNTEARVV
jgi:hypothetical protein